MMDWAEQVFTQPLKAWFASKFPQTREQHRNAMQGAYQILARALGATSKRELLATAMHSTAEGKRRRQREWAKAAAMRTFAGIAPLDQLWSADGTSMSESMAEEAHQASLGAISRRLDALDGKMERSQSGRSGADLVGPPSSRNWLREARAEAAAAAAAITQETLFRARLSDAATGLAASALILGVGSDGEALRLIDAADSAQQTLTGMPRRVLQASNDSLPTLADIPCSGVGHQAIGNETIVLCNGARVTPAVRLAVQALQAAVTAEAGDAVILALEAALLSLPGLNISLLVPASTPIPAGVNFTSLPLATQQALLAAANVSSFANITTFGQIIDADGLIAGGALSATDLLPLLPVNTTIALVQTIQCEDTFEVGFVCACPLEYRGERCESRRSMVLGLRVEDARLRRCLEDPSHHALFPNTAPGAAGEETIVGFGGSDNLASGVSHASCCVASMAALLSFMA